MTTVNGRLALSSDSRPRNVAESLEKRSEHIVEASLITPNTTTSASAAVARSVFLYLGEHVSLHFANHTVGWLTAL